MLSLMLPLILSVTPELCVTVDSDPATTGAPALTAKDLVPALRARLTRRSMRVSACGTSVAPLWRVAVTGKSEAQLTVDFTSEQVAFQMLLEVGGLSLADTIQQLALKIAEAVRPTRDLAFDEPPEPVVEQPVAPVAPAAPAAWVAPLDVEVTGQGGLGVPLIGPTWGGQLAVGFHGTWWRASVGAAVAAPGRRLIAQQVTFSTAAVDLGVGVDLVRSWVELGVRLGARRALVGVATERADVDVRRQDYWAFVAGLRLGWWPLRWHRFALGATLEGKSVWLPRTLQIEGQPALAQSFIEGSVSIGVRLYPFAPADQ